MGNKRVGNEEQCVLPNDKIKLGNQIDILRGFVAYWVKNKRAVSYKEIAPLIGLIPPNISRCLKFWKSIGLIIEDSRGVYRPSEDILKFDFEQGESGLPNIFAKTWFGSLVSMSLDFKDSMTENEIKETIQREYSIRNSDDPKERSLSYCLEILLLSGMLEKSNSHYRLAISDGIKQTKETIELDDETDLVQLMIGNTRYAIERKILLDFIRENGSTLSSEKEVG